LDTVTSMSQGDLLDIVTGANVLTNPVIALLPFLTIALVLSDSEDSGPGIRGSVSVSFDS